MAFCATRRANALLSSYEPVEYLEYKTNVLTAERVSGGTVIAWDEERDRGPWACPECKSEVFLHKGQIKAHHFAHKPPIACTYGAGESAEHRQAKREIYEALFKDPRVTDCKLERKLGESNRPDVSARFNGQMVAIEVQRSDLTVDKLAGRNRGYEDSCVPVIWLMLLKPELFAERYGVPCYAPKTWERELHECGYAYYWKGGLDLVRGRFGDFLLRKEVNPLDWYGHYVGSYSYKYYVSKRWVRPSFDKESHNLADVCCRWSRAWCHPGENQYAPPRETSVAEGILARIAARKASLQPI